MPSYLFEHPISQEVVEVTLSINEPKIYTDENGLRWNRVFSVPQTSFDTKIDPFDSKGFAETTGKKRGTLGDIWDASAELAEKRKQKAGKDSVKEKWLKDYSKKRLGKKHFSDISTANEEF